MVESAQNLLLPTIAIEVARAVTGASVLQRLRAIEVMQTWFEVHLMLQERIVERTLHGHRDATEGIHDLHEAIEPDASVVVYVYAEIIPDRRLHQLRPTPIECRVDLGEAVTGHPSVEIARNG